MSNPEFFGSIAVYWPFKTNVTREDEEPTWRFYETTEKDEDPGTIYFHADRFIRIRSYNELLCLKRAVQWAVVRWEIVHGADASLRNSADEHGF